MLTVENKENSSKEDSPSDNTSEKTANRPVSMSSTPSSTSTQVATTVKASTSPATTVIPAKEDYTSRYWESTQETLVGLYGNRDPLTGQPIEGVNDIIHRVAGSVALAELKYVLTPAELVELTLADAINHPKVAQWTQVFADNIGNQRFWANTPANINADPEISLKVLQYWAFGKLANMKEEDIWLRSEELRHAVTQGKITNLSEHEVAMGHLSAFLRSKGC